MILTVRQLYGTDRNGAALARLTDHEPRALSSTIAIRITVPETDSGCPVVAVPEERALVDERTPVADRARPVRDAADDFVARPPCLLQLLGGHMAGGECGS